MEQKNHFLIWAYGVIDKECGDFLPWLRQKSGAEILSVLSIGKSIYGRSLFASKPIQAGDCILKVPYSVQLAPDNLHPSINSLLASEWAPYISCLPRVEDMHSTVFTLSFWISHPLDNFFNHDANSETDVLSDDFKQVSEVLIRYRKFSNARLLLDFGFIIPSNKYDQVKVEVNAPQNDHLHALKLELLHRHTLVGIWAKFDLTSMGV
ncbi:putative [histone H3]-lysine(4) N-trimethyltransferase [Helianthus anomalus]